MSWPHILSFSRVVASPAVAALILARPGDSYVAAGLLFALASLTDLVDGKLARHGQSVSALGIFLDTTADKVLVGLTLVALAVAGLVGAWIPLVVIGREFLISGLRSFAAAHDRIISAHIWGKGKAALTMAGIFFLLLAADGRAGGLLASRATPAFWREAFLLSSWLLALATLLTVVSGVRYVIDAWPLFRSVPATEDERPRAAAASDR